MLKRHLGIIAVNLVAAYSIPDYLNRYTL